MVVLFALFYLFCFVLVIQNKVKYQHKVLILALCVLTYAIGVRTAWPDELVYQIAFDMAPLPWDFSFNAKPFGYAESGYWFLASCVKVIVDDNRFYLYVMGGLSMFLLYKNLQRYSVFPLIGLCVYIGRFLLTRDFIQMRSSLAILLVLLGIYLIKERKMWHYLLLVFVAYQFHHMAIIGLPLYFLCLLKLKKSHIVIGLVLAFIVSQVMFSSIANFVEAYSEDLQYSTYTEGMYVDDAKGLANPMIYFQVGILLMFTFMEDRLRCCSSYYGIFRTGYFYSTLFLIIFCNYTALSGRTSTMFATLEIFMLPLMAKSLSKKWRTIFLLACGVVFVYFFHDKYSSAMIMMRGEQILQQL